MSILNVYVSPERCLVLTDVGAFNPMERRRIQASKIIPLVHANAVIAMNGDLNFGMALYQCCRILPFVEILGGWDELVATANDYVEEFTKGQGYETPELEQLIVAGWCTETSRCRAMRALRTERHRRWQSGELVPGRGAYSPFDSAWIMPHAIGKGGEADSPRKLCDVAKAQVTATHLLGAGDPLSMSVGGGYVLATVCENRVVLERLAA